MKKAIFARIYSYSIGVLIQICTIFLLTSKLEIYQFSIWGVTVSFIFITSTLTQLSYSQNIEKYFPNLVNFEKKFYLIKYFKTILAISPIVFVFLFAINYFNYFTKFNADNLAYLLIMIATWSTLESLLSLFDTYFLSIKKNITYDLSDLYLYKIPRLILFYIILNNGLSVYYLIASSVLLRFLLFIHLFRAEFQISKETIKYFKNNSIFKDNFRNLTYNIFAFSNNAIYISFVNILFLISNIFNETIDIAHFSLVIVIINNLRPVMNSFTSVLTPIISQLVISKSESKKIVQEVNNFNQLFTSVALITSLLIIEYKIFIQNLLPGYFDGIYKLIFIAIFASTIRSQYFSDYLKLLFNKKEKLLLFFNFINIFFVTLSYLLISNYKTINFVYIYIFYEINFLFYTKYLSSEKAILSNILNNFSMTYIFTIFISFLYFINIFNLKLFFIFPFILFKDLKKYKV